MADFAYLRVSSLGQVDGDGPDRQRLKIESALGRKIPDDHLFFDEAVPGKRQLADRPELTRLFNTAKSGDVVWVERHDRLARDMITSELLVLEFQKSGVTVMSAEGRINLTDGDPDNPSAKLIRQIFGAVAEWEKDSLIIKLRGARQRKKARGERVEGQKPYGDRPGEVEILKRIHALHDLHNFTPSLICADLNNAGLKTRKGTRWNSGTISRILKARKQSNQECNR